MQRQGSRGTDALLLPALPWLKMHFMNQRMNPRTQNQRPREVWGDSTGDGWELQETLWVVRTGIGGER